MEGNGRPLTTEFVVKLKDEIGFGGPFTAEGVRVEIEQSGGRNPETGVFENVEWICEWDGATPGRERSADEFIDD